MLMCLTDDAASIMEATKVGWTVMKEKEDKET